MLQSEHVTWEAADQDHPAQQLSFRSYDAVGRGDKEQWLDLFTDDAVVEDPVGPSYFDPEGAGRRGREGLSTFWDIVIAPVERFHFVVHDSFANGNSCANVATATRTMPDGSESSSDLVAVYGIRNDRISSMRAHWKSDPTAASARAASPDA